jgi:cytochrome c-type biogenesis protein CcmE
VSKGKKFAIGGLVLVLAFGVLGFLGFRASATYYYQVSEVPKLDSSIYGKNIRVNGNVQPGSVIKEDQGRVLKFTIMDDKATLPVYFRGTIPDTFKEDSEVVAEGKLGTDGVLQATTLLAKCPSRYDAETTPAAG